MMQSQFADDHPDLPGLILPADEGGFLKTHDRDAALRGTDLLECFEMSFLEILREHEYANDALGSDQIHLVDPGAIHFDFIDDARDIDIAELRQMHIAHHLELVLDDILHIINPYGTGKSERGV